MIGCIFHEGSGLGNQLFRYIAVRTLAEDKKYECSIVNPENFKGKGFMELDTKVVSGDSSTRNLPFYTSRFEEKKVMENGVDIRSYDPEFNFITDKTLVDGEFQDERYWGHRLNDINKWLKVEPLEMPDNLCVIGFRGGEYYTVPDLGLPKSYFYYSMEKMREVNPGMRFEVHTDDTCLAREFFPEIPIIDNKRISHSLNENMGYNWRAMRYAKYAIIANSSFYIIPRLLRHFQDEALTIAPRYWARRNTKVWALPQNYYSAFTYI